MPSNSNSCLGRPAVHHCVFRATGTQSPTSVWDKQIFRSETRECVGYYFAGAN